jgi:hypothetical protein
MPENVGEVRSIRSSTRAATALFGEMGLSW